MSQSAELLYRQLMQSSINPHRLRARGVNYFAPSMRDVLQSQLDAYEAQFERSRARHAIAKSRIH